LNPRFGTLEKAFEEGKLKAGEPVTEASLRDAGVVRQSKKLAGVRLLGNGEIKRAVQISVSGASAAAIAAIEAAGGKVTLPVTSPGAETAAE
jgi:large subunit ribosomal protein L15